MANSDPLQEGSDRCRYLTFAYTYLSMTFSFVPVTSHDSLRGQVPPKDLYILHFTEINPVT
jgi:hypothetical protein